MKCDFMLIIAIVASIKNKFSNESSQIMEEFLNSATSYTFLQACVFFYWIFSLIFNFTWLKAFSYKFFSLPFLLLNLDPWFHFSYSRSAFFLLTSCSTSLSPVPSSHLPPPSFFPLFCSYSNLITLRVYDAIWSGAILDGGVALILDCNSKHVAHAWRKKGLSEKLTRFLTALDLIKCPNQIK